MALEQISQAVLDAARNEAEHITRAAKHAAEEKLAAARQAAEQDAERRHQTALRSFDEESARRRIQAEGHSGKRLLEKKNQRIEQVFALAQQLVLELPDNELQPVMQCMLEQAASERGGQILAHEADWPFFERIITAVNAGRGAECALSLDRSRTLPERGGFMFVCPQYQVDRTLRTVLAELRHEMAPAIAEELFSALKQEA